jgi:GNAT superfamily N-acetyltransferase
VFVGTIDGVPVGYLLLSQVIAGSTARVEQVWVSPEAREIGFGDDLLAAATDLARSGGASAIEAEALPGDRDTKNLYERAGVTARKLVVWKALGPAGK